METIREQLLYKQNKVNICMRNLSPKEQYECIRLLLATRTKDVKICKHTNTNKYIDKLLSIIDATIINCNSKENLPSSPSLFSSGFVLNH